jgi:hypothetical protein
MWHLPVPSFSPHGNAMVLIKWGVVDITAVHMHRDAHLWGPPAHPLIAKDSLLEIHY